MDHKDILKRLNNNGFPAYLVGGCVRDIISNKTPYDYDITTKATPEQVIQLFSDCKIKEVGKSFGVVLVNDYEVATFRFDNHCGSSLCVVYADNLEDDLARRDLTINSLAYNNEKVIDLFGGKADLENKIIRFVNDPKERIKEDPNRMLRACRFLASIDGQFDEETFNAIKGSGLEDDIAPERIRLEVIKAMKTKKASKFFSALLDTNLLDIVFPSLKDNFEHSMLVGDEVSNNDPILKLAGYLVLSNPVKVRNELKYLTFTNKEIKKIDSLISYQPSLVTCNMDDYSIKKVLRNFYLKGINLKDYFRLQMALCHNSLNNWKYYYKRYSELNIKEVSFTVNDLALSGGEMIKLLDLTPGPIVNTLQKKLLNLVALSGPEYNNKEYLLEVAKQTLLTRR